MASPPRRARVLQAAAAARAPIVVLQAENDHDLGPVREIPPAARAAGRTAEGRTYPAFGSNPAQGHSIGVLAPEPWRDDVLAFLAAHLR